MSRYFNAAASAEAAEAPVAVASLAAPQVDSVLVDQEPFADLLAAPLDESLGTAAPDDLTTPLQGLVTRVPTAQLRSNRWIREASFEIFERTFLITRVMQWLATLVASVGVVSALMALALEHGREFAVLRAQGMTRGELFAVLQLQNVMLGLTAGLLACPLGAAMARGRNVFLETAHRAEPHLEPSGVARRDRAPVERALRIERFAACRAITGHISPL